MFETLAGIQGMEKVRGPGGGGCREGAGGPPFVKGQGDLLVGAVHMPLTQ